MRFLAALVVFGSLASAQNTPANPLVMTSKGMFAISKNEVLRSLDKISDDLWSYRPTPDVRTFGQLFAHIADGQYEFCGVVAEGKSVSKNVEHTATSKADVTSALKEAFAYCDATYDKLTDANAAELVSFFGQKITKLGAMDFNFAHNMEHYGNLVTYMRLKGIVPPSSEQAPAPAAKKQ
jgi:uncharacterized damage-inducible protein DinB